MAYREGRVATEDRVDPIPHSALRTPHSVGRGIASAAMVIAVGNLLSRLLGLGRETVASYYFGTGAGIKPFALADSMLTILYDLLISGMVASALVPVFSEYGAPERREELRRIVGTLLTLALLAIGAATALLIAFAPGLVRLWLTTGAGTIDAELLPEAVKNVRLILPAVMLLGVSAIFMAANYALGRFVWPSVSQAARNLAIIVATVALARWLGVTSMVVGVLAGAVLLIALQLPGLRDALPRPAFDVRHPAIRRILLLYAPIFIGLFANTFGQLIDRNLAWRAGEDALGAMRYATALQQLVLGLVGTGIALGALPALSRQAGAGDGPAEVGPCQVVADDRVGDEPGLEADLVLASLVSIVENMLLGHEVRRHLLLDEVTMETTAKQTLSDLRVTTVRNIRQPVGSLSGGQRQAVAVAKAVMLDAKLVIMDEPTAALDVSQTALVLDLIGRLARRGIAVLVVSHNLTDVFQVADRIAVLYLGRLASVGPASEYDTASVVDLMTTGASQRTQGADVPDRGPEG